MGFVARNVSIKNLHFSSIRLQHWSLKSRPGIVSKWPTATAIRQSVQRQTVNIVCLLGQCGKWQYCTVQYCATGRVNLRHHCNMLWVVAGSTLHQLTQTLFFFSLAENGRIIRWASANVERGFAEELAIQRLELEYWNHPGSNCEPHFNVSWNVPLLGWVEISCKFSECHWIITEQLRYLGFGLLWQLRIPFLAGSTSLCTKSWTWTLYLLLLVMFWTIFLVFFLRRFFCSGEGG